MRLLWCILVWYWCINSVGAPGFVTTKLGNETDRLALIAFKNGIEIDPFRALSSWNDSLQFCNWLGVSCSRRHHQRVTALNLSSQSLVGSLSSHIGNLSFLRTIILLNNSFYGKIPQEIGRLFRLRSLILRNNSFEGEIPTNLTRCSYLRLLNLNNNNLVGKIPLELSSLSKLDRLILSVNSLTGSIPPSLGNLSSLTILSLGRNSFEGVIPEDIGRIGGLQYLDISDNKLNGMIPSPLYNLSAIYTFAVGQNQLHGSLLLDIGLTLPNLKFLSVCSNRLTGPIPYTLSNASGLEFIEFSVNGFFGPVPEDLGRLRGLLGINLSSNRLGTREGGDLSYISSLTNSTSLRVISSGGNLLRGSLPNSIANLSIQMEFLNLGRNQIYGSIPSGIGNLINLNRVDLSGNNLTGSIPAFIGRLHRLQRLYLHNNRFSGSIPSSFGNLTLLNNLRLDNNNLDGHIPPSLGNCQDLLGLNLSHNNLIGTIPKEVMGLSSISISFELAHNALTGFLPLEVGNLRNLGKLDVSNNKLSGLIPNTIGNCVSLEQLYMEGNFFEGVIPQGLRTMRGIQVLDISRNNLSGQIPEFLGEFLSTKNLNLSFNEFEGKVPKIGIFRNASAISVVGNNKLCGGIPELKLPACISHGSKRKGMSPVIRVLTPVAAVVLCLIVLTYFLVVHYWKRTSRKKDFSTPSFKHQYLRISYAKLLKATDGFSEANLIGVGSYGSVYKGILDQDETLVAVKVLNLQQRGASKSFLSECKALKNIRHRNLLKIWSACSSVDFQGNDFKALVFEFMPKGSLEKWLHPEVGGEHELRNLSLIQRVNVAIDVASALEYLHHHSQATIVHCDLKPSNVLLDDDMTAHVGDFGLAKVLFTISSNVGQNQSSSVAIKGSIGYVAPEYGMGSMVSPKGDVYSYGILLLEMFTRKRPTDEMFEEGLSLHNFVKMALPERVMQIIDPHLLLEEDSRGRMQDCLVSVLKIGIACSMELPKDRMEMRDVLMELAFIKGRVIHEER